MLGSRILSNMEALAPDMQVNHHQQEVLRLEQELAALGTDLLTAKRDGKRAEKEAMDGLVRECDENMEGVKTEKNKLQIDVREAHEVQIRKRQEKVAWKEQMEIYKGQVENHEAEQKSAEEALKTAIKKMIDDHGKRVQSNMPKAKIMEKIARNKNLIDKGVEELSSCGDPREVETKYREKNAKLRRASDNLTKYRKLLKELEKGTRNREHNRLYLRDFVAIKIGETFSEFLGMRNFEGSLHFDHNDQELLMHIEKSPSSSACDGRVLTDLKGLSGGERSFLTVSLVLAVWEAMDSPFRCMDEFDVFMDMVNRRLAFDLLVEFAVERNRHNQFIFLTPQDLGSYVSQFERVNIRQLADPRPNAITENAFTNAPEPSFLVTSVESDAMN